MKKKIMNAMLEKITIITIKKNNTNKVIETNYNQIELMKLILPLSKK